MNKEIFIIYIQYTNHADWHMHCVEFNGQRARVTMDILTQVQGIAQVIVQPVKFNVPEVIQKDIEKRKVRDSMELIPGGNNGKEEGQDAKEKKEPKEEFHLWKPNEKKPRENDRDPKG